MKNTLLYNIRYGPLFKSTALEDGTIETALHQPAPKQVQTPCFYHKNNSGGSYSIVPDCNKFCSLRVSLHTVVRTRVPASCSSRGFWVVKRKASTHQSSRAILSLLAHIKDEICMIKDRALEYSKAGYWEMFCVFRDYQIGFITPEYILGKTLSFHDIFHEASRRKGFYLQSCPPVNWGNSLPRLTVKGGC